MTFFECVLAFANSAMLKTCTNTWPRFSCISTMYNHPRVDPLTYVGFLILNLNLNLQSSPLNDRLLRRLHRMLAVIFNNTATARRTRTRTQRTQVHRPNNGHSIRQQMSSGNLIKGTQMSKAWSSDLASVWSLTSVTDNIHSHLSLWSFNC